MECALFILQYIVKAETDFNISLNYRKDVSYPKSIPASFHFRKPGHSFNLHAKFSLIEQLSNIDTTDKDTLNFQLKVREDFSIQKLETLNASIISRNKEKLTLNVDRFVNFFIFPKFPWRRWKDRKLAEKADFLLTFSAAYIIYIYIYIYIL